MTTSSGSHGRSDTHGTLLATATSKMSTSPPPPPPPPPPPSSSSSSSSLPPQLPIFNTVASYRQWRYSLPPTSRVGFVPTLGALHEGHISLIRQAALESDHIVVSIFLNPAQFAPHEDLDAYPKTLEHDLSMLNAVNKELQMSNIAISSAIPSSLSSATPTATIKLGHVEAVFVPTVKEMYPLGIPLDTSKQVGTFVTVQPLASKLEGITRPHFFRGVATVCTKLFSIVQPTHAFFGQKDVQQTIVLRRLVADLHLPIDLRVCPTLREADGLAMSSRNVFLGTERRKTAPALYQALQAARNVYKAGEMRREKIIGAAMELIDGHIQQGVPLKLDYLSLAESSILDEIKVVEGPGAVLSAALIMLPTNENEGSVRLIDNIIFD